MTDDLALCVLGSRPHRADPGLLLCAAHLNRLADTLRVIEDEAIHLETRPSMAVRYDHGGGGLASERSPARIDALVLRDRRRGTGIPRSGEPDVWGYDETPSVLETLHSWARLVREERGLAGPTRRGERARVARKVSIGPFCEDCVHSSCEALSFWLEIPAEPTITGERDLLTRHLSWIAAQPWVDEFYDELRKLAAHLKRVNGTQADKPVGRCYLPVSLSEVSQDPPRGEGSGETCNGPVWVDDAAGHAHCGSCRSTWDGPQLALLKHALDQARIEAARPRTADGRRMLTAAELVAAGMVSTVSNVRVIAHRLGAPSVNGHYDPAMFTERMAQ